jgi:hypothetical protein
MQRRQLPPADSNATPPLAQMIRSRWIETKSRHRNGSRQD